MARANANALYSPYGAYELKARYQRNFALATGSVLALVILILLTMWIIKAIQGSGDDIAAGTVRIKTIAELGPPPTIAKKPPQVNVQKPNVVAPKVGIPKPVADEEVQDEDVTIASREELADIQAPDISTASGDTKVEVNINEDDYLPPPDEFVPVEVQPEMIYQEKPEYPRIAKQAGLTGTVWVKALVDKDGNVRQAMVGKTCGTQALDDAAVAAAYKNKFKPAIQNGRPVAIWVTYKMEFKLND
ncbi:MAG: TonB family protein [Candidatus Zixiibacteriota bacterium]